MALVDDAIVRAVTDHSGQDDTAIGGSGDPMIYHLTRVMAAVWGETGSESMAAVAIMQRLYEDTSTTDGDLQTVGFSAKVRGGISILTRGGSETFKDYIKRIGASDPDAIRVKIIELREAIQNLGLTSDNKERCQKARRYLQEQITIETV
jgi:(p)ppGpp synthase/HD superfamily hydrolase